MRKYSLTPPCNVSVFCVLFFHLLALISPWTYSVKIIRHNSERHREIVHSKNNALCSQCLTVYQSEAYIVDHIERDHQQQQPEAEDNDDDDGVDGEEHEEEKGDEGEGDDKGDEDGDDDKDENDEDEEKNDGDEDGGKK